VQPLSPFPIHDPDLDPPQGRAASSRRPPAFPQEFQRLIANPFLALCWVVILFAVLRQAVHAKSLPLAGVVLLGLVAAGYLLHYHCLDCGATGRLFRWKTHACTSVVVRQQTGRVRRLRGPNPMLQTILWAYLLIPLLLLAYVLAMVIE
jgi:hypothetical protein